MENMNKNKCNKTFSVSSGVVKAFYLYSIEFISKWTLLLIIQQTIALSGAHIDCTKQWRWNGTFVLGKWTEASVN